MHYHQLPVEVIKMRLFSDELAGELQQHFSDGKVPLLHDDAFEVWDSLAILEYLGERFPSTIPWPENMEARAVARSVSAEMHSSFSALRDEAPMNIRMRFPGYVMSEAAQRDVARIQSIWGYCRQKFGADGPWLFGKFTVADAMFAPVVMRFRSVEVDLDDTAKDYCATVNRCESVRKWISLGYLEQDIVAQDEIDWPGELIPQEPTVTEFE